MKLKQNENILDKFKNKLVINTKKCFAMMITRFRAYAFPPEFRIGNSEILTVKKTLRILGVLIQDDLGFESQVREMVRRATLTAWVIRRMRS